MGSPVPSISQYSFKPLTGAHALVPIVHAVIAEIENFASPDVARANNHRIRFLLFSTRAARRRRKIVDITL
jgi:hypothetical protein